MVDGRAEMESHLMGKPESRVDTLFTIGDDAARIRPVCKFRAASVEAGWGSTARKSYPTVKERCHDRQITGDHARARTNEGHPDGSRPTIEILRRPEDENEPTPPVSTRLFIAEYLEKKGPIWAGSDSEECCSDSGFDAWSSRVLNVGAIRPSLEGRTSTRHTCVARPLRERPLDRHTDCYWCRATATSAASPRWWTSMWMTGMCRGR